MSMLLKSPNKIVKLPFPQITAYIFCCYFMVIGSVLANDNSANEKIQIHGFLAQGVIDVNGSDFVNDDQSTSLELTEIGINASYQFSPDIRLAGQAVYLDGGNRFNKGIRLDYLLVEWSLYNDENWQTNLYLGRIKNYHWLYSSIRDVPMTRPSIILPQSVYFDATRDMSIGGDGGAITTQYSHETLGEIDLKLSMGISEVSNTQTNIIMGDSSRGQLKQDDDFQASIYWKPSFSQWRFGLATTIADFTYKEGEQDAFIGGELALKRIYANAEYQGEDWSFSAEILQERKTLTGFLFPDFYNDSVGQGGFIQAQYNLTPKIRLLSRYEHYYNDKNDKNGHLLEQNSGGAVPKYFGYQYDSTIGVNYELSSNLQMKFEYHMIQGTARLTPVLIPDPSINKEESWQLWAVQLMYWF